MKKPLPKPNRKDGRYSGYVFLGYKPDGKEKRLYVYATTKKDLDTKLLDLKIQQATGQIVDKKITVKQWADKWIKNKSGKSERTQKMYRDNLDRYILPVLGDTMLPELKPFHVQDLINDLSNRPRTAQIVKMILDQMFRKAIASELMIKNPAAKDKIDMPSSRVPRKRVINATEIKAIGKADLTNMERVFVILCWKVGLRKSEALAAMTGDISDGKFTVQRAVQDDGSVTAYGKTDAAYRVIPLSDAAKTVLEAYKPSGLYLIHNTKKLPLTVNQYGRFWSRIKSKLNKSVGGKGHISKSGQYVIDLYAIGKNLSAHIMRHSCATNLANDGYSPAQVQYMMGHSTAALTLEIYTHIESTGITADMMNGVKTVSTTKTEQNETNKENPTTGGAVG